MVPKAASELGIPENTMYAWIKAAREERLDVGSGSHTPQTAMNLAGELALLRRQGKSFFLLPDVKRDTAGIL